MYTRRVIGVSVSRQCEDCLALEEFLRVLCSESLCVKVRIKAAMLESNWFYLFQELNGKRAIKCKKASLVGIYYTMTIFRSY